MFFETCRITLVLLGARCAAFLGTYFFRYYESKVMASMIGRAVYLASLCIISLKKIYDLTTNRGD